VTVDQRPLAHAIEWRGGFGDLTVANAAFPSWSRWWIFGWLSILAKPLFLVVNWIADRAVHNYGWSIILVTIGLNFVLFPLKITSMKSMKKMQALQPQIAAINAKYKKHRPPRSEKGGSEPGGDGVIQEARRESHGRLRSHAAADSRSSSRFIRCSRYRWRCAARAGFGSPTFRSRKRLAIHLLPIIMVASQFVMQKMTPTTTGRRSQPAENDAVHAAHVRLHVL
jgi:YidC/Oxa1 family membrane protein insertase